MRHNATLVSLAGRDKMFPSVVSNKHFLVRIRNSVSSAYINTSTT